MIWAGPAVIRGCSVYTSGPIGLNGQECKCLGRRDILRGWMWGKGNAV